MFKNPIISANILHISKFVCMLNPGVKHSRLVMDYELDFQIDGKRHMRINDYSFTVEKGSIIFRKPGDIVISSGNYNTYTLTLDFSKLPRPTNEIYDRDFANKLQPITDLPLLDTIPVHFIANHYFIYHQIFSNLCLEFQLNKDSDKLNILLNKLFSILIYDILEAEYHTDIDESDIVNLACNYISANYSKPLTLKSLSEHFSISQSHFSRLFRQKTNTSPINYILNVRLDNAKRLLEETDLKINYIANQCGFNDSSYFSCYFKKHYGLSPNEVRKYHSESNPVL